MENLGAIAESRYTGFREITDCNVLELHYTVCKAESIGLDKSVYQENIFLISL